jgi:PAS domain S-box-containing protein
MGITIKTLWLSLKVRITLLTLSIIMLCIWSLAYYTSHMLRSDLKRLFQEQQFNIVSIVAEDINQEIDFRLRSLENVVKLISPATINNAPALQKFIEQRPILQYLFNGGCLIIKADGTTVADYPISTGRIGMNVSEKGWMIEALKGKTTVGKPVIGKMLQVPVFTMATPIRNADGKVTAVLAGVVDLKKPNFLDRITNNRYGKTGGYLLIAPQHNIFVTATDKNLIMKSPPAPGVNALFDRYVKGYEGSGIVVDSRGIEVLSSAKQIPSAGWILVARIPTKEAFNPIKKMQKNILLVGIFLTIVTGLVSWLILRRQLSPMLDAVKTLSGLSDSALPIPPLPVAVQDEVGQLIGSFNNLLVSLAHRESSITTSYEMLRESEERFSAAFDSAPIMISISNLEDGTCLDVNRQFLESSEFSRDEVIGKTSVELGWISQSDRNYLKEKMLQFGKIVDLDLNLQAKSGRKISCKYWENIITVAGQKRLLSIALDVTEHRRMEAHLQQAQKIESIGRLAGGVAHDFNNMLGVIIGHAELALLRMENSSPLQNDLFEIRSAAERSADLTRQLLTFARKQTIAPKILNLNDSVSAMLKMLQRLIGEDISLAWLPAPDLWLIKADPSQIDQILANLCVNARDAIENTGRVTIETRNNTIDADYCKKHPDVVPGEYVHLGISDNGNGMDKETLEHIFEPFFTTKELGKGTGLGLATIFGIVKQNNGFINVYSEPGDGSTFTIHFPRHKELNTQIADEDAAVCIPRGQETILLVEDEPVILRMASMMLTMQGYTVLTAGSPDEAIRLAREHGGEINLLMTDVIMPGMNGKDMANTLRQSVCPNLKSLFMSGYTADVIAHHGVLGEQIHFIQKPFSLHVLACKVRNVLDN